LRLAVERATGCICGSHLLEPWNEGTCLKCGHGNAFRLSEVAYRLNASSRPTPALDARIVPLRRARAHEWTEEELVRAYRAWERDHGRPPTSSDWQRPRARSEHRPTYKQVLELLGGWGALKRAVAEVPRDQVEPNGSVLGLAS
jgi:hypothetical protein